LAPLNQAVNALRNLYRDHLGRSGGSGKKSKLGGWITERNILCRTPSVCPFMMKSGTGLWFAQTSLNLIDERKIEKSHKKAA